MMAAVVVVVVDVAVVDAEDGHSPGIVSSSTVCGVNTTFPVSKKSLSIIMVGVSNAIFKG